MSASTRNLLLGAFALGASLVLFTFFSDGGGRRGTGPRPPRAEQVAGDSTPDVAADDAGLIPVGKPARLDVASLERTTVLWPLRVELDLVQAAYLPSEEGMLPIGSGADAILTGHVVDAQDSAVAATVTFRAGPNKGRVLRTDRNGSFGASDLLPGLSIVDLHTAAGSLARREIILRRGKETPLAISFSSPGVVTGKVLDKEGAGIEGASVRVDGTECFTDPDGNFFAGRVAAGQVLVEIEHADYAAYQELVWVASALVAPRTDVTFTLHEATSLRIALTTDVGGPGPVEILLLPGNTARRPSQEAYRNSRYPYHRLNPIEVWPGRPHEIEGLPAEVVQVFAFRPGAKAKQAIVNLRTGRPYDLKLQLEPAPTIRGQVLRDGEPVLGASVRLEAPDIARTTLSFLRQTHYYLESADLPVFPVARQDVITDEQGRFLFTAWEDVSPTRYLEALGPRGTGWAGRLVHRGDREANLELETAEFEGGRVAFELPGRWQGLPVEVLLDGNPEGPRVLSPEEDLVVEDLTMGRWHARLSWHGELIDESDLKLGPEAFRRVELPAACIEGQDEETWRRAGRDYPEVP